MAFAEAKKLGRQADKYLREHAGEMVTGVILTGVRQARLADLKEKQAQQVERELELVRLQLLLAAVTDQEAKRFMEIAQQFDASTPIFQRAEKELYDCVSNEARQEMAEELLRQKENHVKAQNINLAQALVPLVEGEVAYEVYEDAEWDAAREREKAIEAAGTEAEKASAVAAYDNFKKGLSQSTKAKIKEASKIRFLEIADATGKFSLGGLVLVPE